MLSMVAIYGQHSNGKTHPLVLLERFQQSVFVQENRIIRSFIMLLFKIEQTNEVHAFDATLLQKKN